MILDIDASLVEIHTDGKENAAPTYKGGFGFHPMFCFADATGEVLAGLLRPGNAGANTVADHFTVLDQAIAQLPPEIARGHRAGDDPEAATRTVVVRADSAGCTEGFLAACRARNVSFFVTARSNPQVTAAVCDAIGIEQVWEPALTQDGEPRDGAAVCELTSLINDDKLPEGTRLSSDGSRSIPGPSAACSRVSTSATGASTPMRKVRRSSWTPPCGPTPTSNSTSSG